MTVAPRLPSSAAVSLVKTAAITLLQARFETTFSNGIATRVSDRDRRKLFPSAWRPVRSTSAFGMFGAYLPRPELLPVTMATLSRRSSMHAALQDLTVGSRFVPTSMDTKSSWPLTIQI